MVQTLSEEVKKIKESLILNHNTPTYLNTAAKAPDLPSSSSSPKQVPKPPPPRQPGLPPNDSHIVVDAVVEVHEGPDDMSISSIEEFMPCPETEEYLNGDVLTSQLI